MTKKITQNYSFLLRVTFSIYLNMVQIPVLNSDYNYNYPLFSPCQIYEPFTEDDFSVILGTVLLVMRYAIYIYIACTCSYTKGYGMCVILQFSTHTVHLTHSAVVA